MVGMMDRLPRHREQRKQQAREKGKLCGNQGGIRGMRPSGVSPRELWGLVRLCICFSSSQNGSWVLCLGVFP